MVSLCFPFMRTGRLFGYRHNKITFLADKPAAFFFAFLLTEKHHVIHCLSPSLPLSVKGFLSLLLFYNNIFCVPA